MAGRTANGFLIASIKELGWSGRAILEAEDKAGTIARRILQDLCEEATTISPAWLPSVPSFLAAGSYQTDRQINPSQLSPFFAYILPSLEIETGSLSLSLSSVQISTDSRSTWGQKPFTTTFLLRRRNLAMQLLLRYVAMRGRHFSGQPDEVDGGLGIERASERASESSFHTQFHGNGMR